MADTDYYELLEVERGADEAALKSAYRRLAMKYHPDRNPGDAVAEQKFKAISEAYDVLKDPQKRAAYDRYGHAAFRQGGGGGGMPVPGGEVQRVLTAAGGERIRARADHRRNGNGHGFYIAARDIDANFGVRGDRVQETGNRK
jgi:molecular chaperone DnaJ